MSSKRCSNCNSGSLWEVKQCDICNRNWCWVCDVSRMRHESYHIKNNLSYELLFEVNE